MRCHCKRLRVSHNVQNEIHRSGRCRAHAPGKKSGDSNRFKSNETRHPDSKAGPTPTQIAHDQPIRLGKTPQTARVVGSRWEWACRGTFPRAPSQADAVKQMLKNAAATHLKKTRNENCKASPYFYKPEGGPHGTYSGGSHLLSQKIGSPKPSQHKINNASTAPAPFCQMHMAAAPRMHKTKQLRPQGMLNIWRPSQSHGPSTCAAKPTKKLKSTCTPPQLLTSNPCPRTNHQCAHSRRGSKSAVQDAHTHSTAGRASHWLRRYHQQTASRDMCRRSSEEGC